jgi:hypothetical protein
MSTLAETIRDYMMGTNGEIPDISDSIQRDDMVEAIEKSSVIGDWVHEASVDSGFEFSGAEKAFIARLMIYAALQQWEYDAKYWESILVDLPNKTA